MELHNEAIRTRNPDAPLMYSQSKIENTRNGVDPIVFPATDWRKALFKDYSMNQRFNLNVSGGGKVAHYYVAGSMNRDRSEEHTSELQSLIRISYAVFRMK